MNFYSGDKLKKIEPQNILSEIESNNLMPEETIEAIMGLNTKGFVLLTTSKLIYGSINKKKPEKNFWHEFLISDLTINNVYKKLNLKIQKDNTSIEFKKVNALQKDIDSMYDLIIAKIDPSLQSIETPKKSFFEKVNEQAKEINAQKLQEKQRQEERIKQMDRDGIAYCPKCYSTSLSAHKKGFGIGKAVVGASLTGGIGLVAGNIGAKKVRVTCLKCGHQFWAGKK